jgi:RNA polymerase sigma-70 factor, ECF subfamily
VSQETQNLVRGVIAGLPAKDRDLLTAVLAEKSSTEICKQFGVDANYLRVRMHRARERFRKALERKKDSPR